MKVLANNCVSKIEIPEGVTYSGNGVAYNPVLGLFVTVDCDEGISVWNPVSRELMAECDLGPDGDLNMTLLPGNRIAVSHSEPNHWSSVEILSLEEDTFGNSPELDFKSAFFNLSWSDRFDPAKEPSCGRFGADGF